MAYQKPDHCRYAERAAKLLGYSFEELDDGGGYLFRVSDGAAFLVLGAGRLSPYAVNSAASVSVSKDKVFTNRLLTESGIPNLGGRGFFLVDDHSKLRKAGYELADARVYLRELGFPCFAKPLAGSRGDFAEVIASPEAFEDYVLRVAKKHDSIILQQLSGGDEYRVVVLDGEPLFCVKKRETALFGDGVRSIGDFIDAMNSELRGTGVSGLPGGPVLAASGRVLSRSDVPAAGERVVLSGRRNLSATAAAGELVEPVPGALGEMARRAAAALALRMAGIDFFCDGDLRPDSIRVIEVNASPGIHTLELLGRMDLIDGIWAEVLRRSIAARRAELGRAAS